MSKIYRIPHNYTNNGRVFNMFKKRDLKRALIWAAPVTFIIFNLPLSFVSKFSWSIIIVIPPAIAILASYADWLQWSVVSGQWSVISGQ